MPPRPVDRPRAENGTFMSRADAAARFADPDAEGDAPPMEVSDDMFETEEPPAPFQTEARGELGASFGSAGLHCDTTALSGGASTSGAAFDSSYDEGIADNTTPDEELTSSYEGQQSEQPPKQPSWGNLLATPPQHQALLWRRRREHYNPLAKLIPHLTLHSS